MTNDGVVFSHSRDRDPDGAKLGGTVEAHLALEQARGLRHLMVHFVAVASVPLALVAEWSRAPRVMRWLAFAVWTLTFAGVVVAALSEWKYRRLRAQLIGEIAPSDRRAP